MGENIKQNIGNNPTFKFERTQTIPNTINFKTLSTKKHIFSEVENRKETKKNIKFLTRKKPLFFVEKKKISNNPDFNDGRWTEEEHNKFLQGIIIYGVRWKKVKSLIKTRTAIQVSSHAQKFFYKMKTCKDDNLGINFTLSSIHNIKDMINHIKTINPNYNSFVIFKKLSSNFDNIRKFKRPIKKSSNKKKLIIDNENKNINVVLEKENKNYLNNNKLPIIDNLQINDNLEKHKNNLKEPINNNITNSLLFNNNSFLTNSINTINNNILNNNNYNYNYLGLSNYFLPNLYTNIQPNHLLNIFKNNYLNYLLNFQQSLNNENKLLLNSLFQSNN